MGRALAIPRQWLAAFCLLSAFSDGLWGQAQKAVPTRPPQAAKPVPKRLLRVPLWSPEPGQTLQATDLKARLNLQPATILQVVPPASDLIVMMVVDTAGDASLADSAKQALLQFTDKLPDRTLVAVLRANDDLKVMQDPTRDAEALRQSILSLPTSGRAGLLDSLEAVAQVADTMLVKSGVRVAVLYVTDSDIANYRDDYTNPVVNKGDARDLSRRFGGGLVRERISQLDARLASRQAPLFIVHLNNRTDALNVAYQTGLQQLASMTGGVAVFCRSLGEISAAIANALGQIQAHHVVLLQVPEKASKNVQVELTAPEQVLSYRSRIRLP